MQSNKGFTLIEVIVTIVIVTMASLAVFTFLNGMVTRSGEAVSLVQDLALAQSPLEEMAAEYHDYLQDLGAGEGNWTTCKDAFQDIKADYEGSGEGFNVAIKEVSSELESPGFEIIEATSTKGKQTLSTLFSE